MIFWIGNSRTHNFLIQLMYAENIFFEKAKSLSGISVTSKIQNGFVFTRRVGFKDGNLKFYNVLYHSRDNHYQYYDELPLFTDKDPIEKMPDRLAIKTDNIDFIRKLFFLGKTVSWYDPDLKNASFFVKFNFEHLFINVNKHYYLVVHPDGTVLPRVDEFGNYNFDLYNGKRGQYKAIKWARKIGYIRRALDERVNGKQMLKNYHRFKWKYKPELKFMHRIGGYHLVSYFNFMSITYMLWKKSIAQNVKSNANKG